MQGPNRAVDVDLLFPKKIFSIFLPIFCFLASFEKNHFKSIFGDKLKNKIQVTTVYILNFICQVEESIDWLVGWYFLLLQCFSKILVIWTSFFKKGLSILKVNNLIGLICHCFMAI